MRKSISCDLVARRALRHVWENKKALPGLATSEGLSSAE
jgi:hypothetical protein